MRQGFPQWVQPWLSSTLNQVYRWDGAHHVTLGLQSQKNLESIWLKGLLCPAQDPRASRMSWRPPFNRPRQPSANRSTFYLDWFLERHLQMGHLFSLNPIKCFWVYSAGYSHRFLNNYTVISLPCPKRENVHTFSQFTKCVFPNYAYI